MLFIADTGTKGRGVFTTTTICKWETLETSPIIIIEAAHLPTIEKTSLKNYYYNWEDGKVAIGLGLTSLYNHSDSPNVEFVKHFDTQVIQIRALREIESLEELTIDYRLDDDTTLWFDNKE